MSVYFSDCSSEQPSTFKIAPSNSHSLGPFFLHVPHPALHSDFWVCTWPRRNLLDIHDVSDVNDSQVYSFKPDFLTDAWYLLNSIYLCVFFIVGPCWLSLLNIAVHTCQSQTPNLSIPLPSNHKFILKVVWICFCLIKKFIYGILLDSMYKWYYMIFVFVWLL